MLDPFQSSADHPLQSIRVHRLVYSMLIRQQDLISDLELQCMFSGCALSAFPGLCRLCFSVRVAKIIQRYQALRPFHLIVHDRSRPHTEFPPFAFMYELPSLWSFCPSSIDQALVQAVDDYRQNILRGPPSSLSVGC